MSLMERDYMREDYKKNDTFCKRWNGKEERQKKHIESIISNSFYTNKPLTDLQYNSAKNYKKKNNGIIRSFIISFIICIIFLLLFYFLYTNNIMIF